MENNTQNNTQQIQVKTTKKPNKLLKWLWISALLVLVGIVGLFSAATYGILGEMPNVKDLENPDIYVASDIISQDGAVIDKFEREKRIPVYFNQLPPHLVNGLIAKEDKRFFEHSGIDWNRTGSAIVTLGRNGGGSTITQQLAKLLFSKKSRNKVERVIQKVKENIVAVQLERLYTKEEIIAMYFNKFNFLNKAYGIQMASHVYFNKDVSKLTPDESAVFVAMFQKPYDYNPKSNATNAILGRNGVLVMMEKAGFMSTEEVREYKAKPIKLDFQPVIEGSSQYSAYYKQFLRSEIEGYLKQYEAESGKKYDVYKDGLKVYVTLDSRMQKHAEEAMKEHLMVIQRMFNAQERYNKKAPFTNISSKQAHRLMMYAVKRTARYKTLKANGLSDEEVETEFKKPIRLEIFTWKKGKEDTLMSPWDSIKYHKHIVRGSLMSMEPQTGNIKAWVGGIDWDHFKYDLVKQGKRQVGSTFKPIVYAAAMKELGYNPCTMISNATYSKGGWNVAGRGGSLSIRDGIAHSKNPITARLMEDVGVDLVIKLAKNMGITSPLMRNNTIALGSGEVSLYEMVGAYGTFANNGTYSKPQMIWRLEDSKGKVLKENQPEFHEVMNEMYAYQMLDIMMGVTQYGTAKSMRGRGISGQVAGKTGTTDLNADTWFMGIVPKLVTGVWVGWEDRAAKLLGNSQGSTTAMPVWVGYMKKVYADTKLGYKQDDKFIIPKEEEYTECGYPDISADAAEDLYGLGDIINGEHIPDSPKQSSDGEKQKDVNQKLSDVDTVNLEE